MKKHIQNLSSQKQYQDFVTHYTKQNYSIFDLYHQLILERFAVGDPAVYFANDRQKRSEMKYQKHLGKKKDFQMGVWLILDKLKEVYHLPKQLDLLHLRTVRNRNLIDKEEQEQLYHANIAIAGLSVGSNVAMAFVRFGIGNRFKIADMDTVDPHNLNRAQYFLKDIGTKKTELIANQMLRVDPYLEIECWNAGLDEERLSDFVQNTNIIIDCFDNFKIKLALRHIAKQFKKPVLSGFDIANGCLVIVERYDTEPVLNSRYYLNGFDENVLSKPVTRPEDKTNAFINIIGREYHSPQMLESVLDVGTNLTGYPQLITATQLFSAAMTKVASDVLLGKQSKSMRSFINLEQILR